jgi:hypothetical protein
MRLMLTCVAVALLAGPAAAGPIVWSYQTEVVYSGDYGDRFVVNLAPGATVVSEAGVWDGIGHPLFDSTLVPRPLPGEYQTQYSFAVNVTITDAASGESATFPTGGWYSAMWSYPPEERDNPDAWRWDWEVSEFGDPGGWSPVRFGDVVYSVRTYGGGQGQAPNGVLVVGTDFVGTPEPGTLALAALGLGVVGVVRRK